MATLLGSRCEAYLNWIKWSVQYVNFNIPEKFTLLTSWYVLYLLMFPIMLLSLFCCLDTVVSTYSSQLWHVQVFVSLTKLRDCQFLYIFQLDACCGLDTQQSQSGLVLGIIASGSRISHWSSFQPSNSPRGLLISAGDFICGT